MTPILTETQARALAGTKAATPDGLPLVLHHGTHYRFDRFERTQDLGFHFGTRAQAACRLSTLTTAERKAAGDGEPRIVSVALAARSPLLIPEDPMTWEPRYLAGLIGRFLSRREATFAKDQNPPRVERVHILRSALLREGFDSIVYRNRVESVARGRGVEWSWLALDPAMIVNLGEDLAADHAKLPAGKRGEPGFDPNAALRIIGGLRKADGGLASVKEMRQFRDAAVALCQRTFEGLARTDSTYRRAACDLTVRVGDMPVEIQVNGDIGRLRVRAQPINSRVLEKAGFSRESIQAEYGESPRFVDGLAHLTDTPGFEVEHRSSHLMPTMIYQAEWVPGEPIGAWLARCAVALPAISAALVEISEPEAAFAP